MRQDVKGELRLRYRNSAKDSFAIGIYKCKDGIEEGAAILFDTKAELAAELKRVLEATDKVYPDDLEKEIAIGLWRPE